MPEPITPPPLPVTWRPRRPRIVAYSSAAVIVLGSVIMAVFIAEPFKLPDRLAIVAFGCAVAFVLHLLGRVRVDAMDAPGTCAVPTRPPSEARSR